MSARSASPFSRFGVLAILLVGFGAFAAMLYFIGMGDTGAQDSENGRAHAAASGLNGYSALVKLVEADGFETELSREQSGLEAEDILVLTPPRNMKPDQLREIIETRDYLGPTLVILPKWGALPSRFVDDVENPEDAKRGWVVLREAGLPRWAFVDEGPLALDLKPRGVVAEENDEPAPPPSDQRHMRFETNGDLAGLSGVLPDATGFVANPKEPHTALVATGEGETLVVSYPSQEDDPSDAIPHWVVFVIEPDLMNNWGIADPERAQTALSIIRLMGDGFNDRVVFDLTANGFGGTLNLLTFAFRPPFLAATICLLLAILILGWRAFFRFGPAAVPARATAFGKAQLVANGADLIVRGNRLGLLAKPYAALSARRMAARLGLTNSDPEAIDAALEARKADQPRFSKSVGDLANATKPDSILNAAQALYHQSSRDNRDTKGIPKE